MSYVGAFPADTTVESESHVLVDAALASVRRDAGLDEDPVLPPLHVLLGQTRVTTTPSVRRVPSAEAIVKTAATPSGPVSSAPAAAASSRPLTPIPPLDEALRATRQAVTIPSRAKTGQSWARRLSWPVLLCGFVGGTFGGVALMKSPIGQTPVVQKIVSRVLP